MAAAGDGGEEIMAEFNTWEEAVPEEGDGISRWEWETEGLWLGIMIYNPQNGLGLLVTSVDPEGQAGSRGVKLGDRMVELNGRKIPYVMQRVVSTAITSFHQYLYI
jgi:predicted metalloprotease with PDZ domain